MKCLTLTLSGGGGEACSSGCEPVLALAVITPVCVKTDRVLTTYVLFTLILICERDRKMTKKLTRRNTHSDIQMSLNMIIDIFFFFSWWTFRKVVPIGDNNNEERCDGNGCGITQSVMKLWGRKKCHVLCTLAFSELLWFKLLIF